MSKVTVGFKCQPELKQELLQEAVRSGITMSEYVESLCANRDNPTIQEVTDYEEDESVSEELESAGARLYEYEEVLLGPWFQKYRGKTLQIHDEYGQSREQLITQPVELLEAILSSLKSQYG